MNLEVFDGEELIFEDNGSWLHPLFKLEEFLNKNNLLTEGLFLKDKVIGRGAAVIIVKLGIKRCHGKLVSKRALPILKENQVEITWDKLINRIDCKTEELITTDLSISAAYNMLLRRAN